MNKQHKANWERAIEELIAKARSKASNIDNFTALEDLALEEGQRITQMILQGIVRDKGSGNDIELPEELAKSKPKNKGLKKNHWQQELET